MYLIGYDIGSSTVKAALIDAQTNRQVLVAQSPAVEMDLIARQSGWAEQQPEIWWQHVGMATRQLLKESGVAASAIKGIGIAYQMHGLVLIDKAQNILRPSIIWCDSRAVQIGREAFQEIGEDWCLQNCLNSPGNFTASKLKWVKDNEPEIYERIDKVLLPGDYIAMKFTGQVNTTISGLSEAILWDFKRKEVSQQILDYYGIDRDLLPEVVSGFSDQGRLTRHASIATGLEPGTPVTYRAGDQPNNALSLNVLQPGEIAATSGTSGVVYGIVDRPLYDEKTRVNSFAHVNYENKQNRIGILLCLNGAGIQYSWMKHQVARTKQQYTDMERMLSSVPIGSGGICILPFGNGAERMLHNRNVHAHILNLDFNVHSRAHLFRAALEGVAFSFVYGVEILKELGLAVNVMRVGNDNMFQSATFSKTMATLLDCDIEVVNTTGAAGAARAAGIATGAFSSLEEAVGKIPPLKVYHPSLNRAECLQAYSYWQASLKKMLQKEQRRPTSHTQERAEHLEEQQARMKKKMAIQHLEAQEQLGLLQTIQKELKAINVIEPKAAQQIKALEQKIARQIQQANLKETLTQYVDLLEDDFVRRLKEQYPGLTAQELQLAAFVRMGWSTKHIAEHFGLSDRGVETRRYRLRKKMKLTGKRSLTELLASL